MSRSEIKSARWAVLYFSFAHLIGWPVVAGSLGVDTLSFFAVMLPLIAGSVACCRELVRP